MNRSSDRSPGRRDGDLRHFVHGRPHVSHLLWAVPWCVVGGIAAFVVDTRSGHDVAPIPVVAGAYLAIVTAMHAVGVTVLRGHERWNRLRVMAWWLPPAFVALPLVLG